MAQSVSSEYTAVMADPSKALDFILVIAGHPTVYSVAKDDYTLAGDLANFTTIRAWMNVPRGASQKVKGRPEEAKMTIGQLDVEIQDRHVGGKRELTDLASRFAYLLGQSSGNETQLNGALTLTGTTVTVDSTTGFASSGNIYIGKECIKYTGTTGTTFTGCTRGYLLTDPWSHRDNVKVYDYLPSLHRRPAFLYKGTQGLTLDKWVKAFSGIITAEHKADTLLKLAVNGNIWETHGNGKAWFMNPGNVPTGAVQPDLGTIDADLYDGDFTAIGTTMPSLGDLNSGHWIVIVGEEYAGIRSAS